MIPNSREIKSNDFINDTKSLKIVENSSYRKITLKYVCVAIFFCFWGLSATRHFLLQSNAYDLGLFDQWVWLTSQGLPPFSSMEGVHILADHGAFSLYLAAVFYKVHPTIHWLLASQAAALSVTAIPIWWTSKQAKLSNKLCWLACGLWWLQPVVFNVNLFDFHPEVWVMPALATSFWASRKNKFWIWILSIVLLLSCRDGLVLVVIGLGLEQALRRNWTWAIGATGIGLGWFAMLNQWLYPTLNHESSGPKAIKTLFSYLGNDVNEIALNILTNPKLIINNIDWKDGLFYLILITVPVAPFLRKNSLKVLFSALPLVVINILSSEAPQRTLIHHYSLPIAVIAVIATIDGLAIQPKQKVPWKLLIWSSICWACLAKPWFFGGHYLTRVDSIWPTNQAFEKINAQSKVLTTSYLVPHLSQREKISFPKENLDSNYINGFDILLLNPKDPGWGSSSEIQLNLLKEAKQESWYCSQWSNGLELCQSPIN